MKRGWEIHRSRQARSNRTVVVAALVMAVIWGCLVDAQDPHHAVDEGVARELDAEVEHHHQYDPSEGSNLDVGAWEEEAHHGNCSLHAFFYLWYGNPTYDGGYVHWNHEQIPHWDPNRRHEVRTPMRAPLPPNDVASPFYPLRGPYSSRDPDTTALQLHEMTEAGIGVAVVGWTGQASNPRAVDGEGVRTDLRMPVLLEAARATTAKIAIHIEPYVGRDEESVRDDLEYITREYAWHESMLRVRRSDGACGAHVHSNAHHDEPEALVPVYYMYDSYRVAADKWARLLTPDGEITIRGTPLDGFFYALCLDRGCVADAARGGFDGIYTYFAADISYGSRTRNWKAMVEEAHDLGLRVSLSVGPGYDDTRIRPWNAVNTRPRRDGAYYTEMWAAAIAATPDVVSVTSYNEWGEGTQIEPAVPRLSSMREYAGYGSLYLDLTREQLQQWVSSTTDEPQ